MARPTPFLLFKRGSERRLVGKTNRLTPQKLREGVGRAQVTVAHVDRNQLNVESPRFSLAPEGFVFCHVPELRPTLGRRCGSQVIFQ
jgi:hypothetical protein